MSASSSTVVVQSFREYDVPPWVERCLATVKAWAGQRGFSYRMKGDEFLQLAPDWYRRKARNFITVAADLARLLFARECLNEGFDRVIWVDADMVVFRPGLLRVDVDAPYAYCREVWIETHGDGRFEPQLKVNNAACAFRGDSRAHLEEYIESCISIVRELPRVRDHTEVGTRFLTALHRQKPLPILPGFGLLCPAMMKALLRKDDALLNRFVEWQGDPLYAVNLCNFLRAKQKGGPGIGDEMYSAVIDTLLDGRGFPLGTPPAER
ncbi:MAG: hypothetical protein LAP21_19795 [Acidobacteriia bacterium]|nr:hypothetical protein [Terriglobia bacterium]